jgi:adenylate kinase
VTIGVNILLFSVNAIYIFELSPETVYGDKPEDSRKKKTENIILIFVLKKYNSVNTVAYICILGVTIIVLSNKLLADPSLCY